MKELTQRLQRLRKLMRKRGLDALLLAFPPNVFYLTHFSSTFAFLYITRRSCLLLTDFRYQEAAEKQLGSLLEIVTVKKGLREALPLLSRRFRAQRVGIEAAHLTVQFYRMLRSALPGKKLLTADDLMRTIRAQKSPWELRQLRRAAALTDQLLARIRDQLKPGMQEHDVARLLRRQAVELGAEELAFTPIVATGRNASKPHYQTGNTRLRVGQPLLIDLGVKYNGYCADLTRTIWLGKPTGKLYHSFQLVREAQLLAREQLKPGVAARDVDVAVRRFFTQHGLESYFGHGLGHGVGLEIHEAPTLNAYSKDTLQAGMVFTLEPGLYFPGRGGIRHEDLLHLNDHSYEVLSKTPAELVVA